MSEQGAILSAEEMAALLERIEKCKKYPWADYQHLMLYDAFPSLVASHAALAAQLATAQATIAELEKRENDRQQWIDGYFKKQDYESQIAAERERRIASEGREGELKRALEAIENVGMDEAGITRTTTMASAWECQKIARDALATPASDRAGGADGG